MDTFAVTITSSSTPVAFTVSAGLRFEGHEQDRENHEQVPRGAHGADAAHERVVLGAECHRPVVGRCEVNVGHLAQALLVGTQEHALDGADYDRHGYAPLDIELAPNV